MPGLISQFQQSAYTTPVNGGALDASVVLGNDNATRGKHNGHDADATIHLQSSTLGTRAAAGVAQRAWWTTDEFRLYFDFGGVWNPLKVRAEDVLAGTFAGNQTFGANLTITGVLTANGNVVLGDAAGDTLTINPSAVTWANNPTHSGNHTFSGNVVLEGNTTLGNAVADTVTFTGRIASNVGFTTDNANDVGAAGANRPRTGFFGTSAVIGTDPGGGRALRVGGGATFLGDAVTVQRSTYNATDYFNVTDGTGTGSVYLSSATVMRYKMTGNSSEHRFMVNTNLGGELEGLRVRAGILTIDATSVWIGYQSTMYQVKIGAANSGGAGFRQLIIDN